MSPLVRAEHQLALSRACLSEAVRMRLAPLDCWSVMLPAEAEAYVYRCLDDMKGSCTTMRSIIRPAIRRQPPVL